MSEPARNADGLPLLFGYAQLERIYGWKRRTLENAVRAGMLRKPSYSGKAAFWFAADIDNYLNRLRGELEELAVRDPSKLEPDEVAEAAFELAARHLQNVAGQKISAEQVLLGRRATPQEMAAFKRVQAEQMERATEAITPPDEFRQILVVNWLFPAIGKLIRGQNTFLPSGDMARLMGLIALNDEDWAAMQADLKSRGVDV